MNPTDFDIGVLKTIPTKSYTTFWLLAISGATSIALARVISGSYITGLFKYSKNYNQQLFSLNSLSSPLLTFNYLIAITLFLSVFIDAIGQASIENSILFILLCVTGFYIIKSTVQFLLANWFHRKDIFDLKNAVRIYQIVGMIILPIAIFALYQSSEIQVNISIFSFIIIFISLALFWYFSLRDSIQHKISLFYIFLYLCTLEILPLLLIAKYLLD